VLDTEVDRGGASSRHVIEFQRNTRYCVIMKEPITQTYLKYYEQFKSSSKVLFKNNYILKFVNYDILNIIPHDFIL